MYLFNLIDVVIGAPYKNDKGAASFVPSYLGAGMHAHAR